MPPFHRWGGSWVRLALEHLTEARNDDVFDLGNLYLPTDSAFERGHSPVGYPARDDQVELVQVRAHVERESVAGDPAREPNTDCADLVLANPGAGHPVTPLSCQTVVRADADHDLLKVTHVTMYVAPIGTQVEDRIPDDLPWAVIRDVAATPGLVNLYAARGQQRSGGHNMRPPTVAFDADSDDRRVLEQKEKVGNMATAPLFDERPLKIKGLLIRDTA